MAIKASSQMTLIDLTDAYSVFMTNEAHTFLGTTTAVNGTQTTTTQIMALCGNDQVPCTIGTMSCPNGVTAVSDGKTPSPTITITATSAVTAGGSFDIPITVNGDITINKKFSYSVAFKGATGATGAQGIQGIQGPKGDQGVQGPTGASGKTTYFHIKYSSVSNPTTSSQMTETPSTYIGTYVDFTETDSTDPSKYTWSQFKGSQGVKGDQGIPGTNGTNGQTSYLHIAYATNSTGTAGFSTTDGTGKTYIGQYTDFTVADSTVPSKYTWTLIKGATGATGATGPTGPTGVGISSITEYYQVSSSNSTAPTSWVTTVPTMTATNRYLWNYERITYTNSTTKDTTKRVIGVYGDKGNTGATGATGPQGPTGATGATGATGVGVKSSAVTYQASSSGTTVPTGTWSSSIPSVAAGQFLWTRTVVTYTNNTTTTSYSVGKMGNTGATGATGSAGKGIKSTAVTYKAAANGTTVPTGTWSGSVPATSADKPYLWTRTIITYTDNTTTTSYSVGSTPEGIVVGGRNLVIGSSKASATSLWLRSGWDPVIKTYSEEERIYAFSVTNGWGTFGYKLPDDFIGKVLTMSFWAKIDWTVSTSTDMIDLQSAYSNEHPGIEHIVDTFAVETAETAVWKKIEFTITTTDAFIGFCFVARSGDSATHKCTMLVRDLKLELGNKATDWTPAPEDVQQGIDGAQGTADAAVGAGQNNADQISKVSSELQILKDNITSMVSSDKSGTVIQQTDEGWVLNMGDSLSRLDKLDDVIYGSEDDETDTGLNGKVEGLNGLVDKIQGMTNDLVGKTAYIIMKQDDDGNPYMELGKEDNPFKVRITNTSIDFMEGSQKIAYITNHSLYIQSSVVTDEMQIGESPGWVWKKRENGNLGLRWKA